MEGEPHELGVETRSPKKALHRTGGEWGARDHLRVLELKIL